jgi:hypothetical protein
MKCIKIILSGERVVKEMMEGTKLIKVHFKHVCKWDNETICTTNIY